MELAFASPAAKKMAADEPNFLGHGSGYALRQEYTIRSAEGGPKLIIAVVNGSDQAVDRLETLLENACGVEFVRCDVQSLIGKPAMAPPQSVRTFFHVFFNDAQAALAFDEDILPSLPGANIVLAIFKVRTLAII